MSLKCKLTAFYIWYIFDDISVEYVNVNQKVNSCA